MMPRAFRTLIAVMLLAGAMPPAMARDRASRDEAPVCAAHWSDVPVHRAGITKVRKVKAMPFARESSCLRFGDGREEPVMLFAVDVAPPLQATIEVDNRRDKILAARVEALDADGALIAGYPFDSFTRRGGMYSLDLFGNDEVRPIKWLMIRIDADAVGRMDTRLVSNHAYFVFPTGGAYTHAYEAEQKIAMGDTGFVKVVLQSLNESE